MKKIVLALAVVFSVALVSCGNKNAEATDSAADSINVEEVEVVDTITTDSGVVVDSAAAVAVEESAQ